LGFIAAPDLDPTSNKLGSWAQDRQVLLSSFDTLPSTSRLGGRALKLLLNAAGELNLQPS